jgi:glycosyltransferase involved in cell wall biosynthesis
MKIWANTLVRNEERYIWFSVMSVVEYVDKILIFDTGSDDSTVEIIKEIKKAKPGKVEFRQYGKVDTEGFTQARQEMLEKTKSDWLILLDGDEVWWEDSIFDATNLIRRKGKDVETIVNKYYNVIGDIFHYQEEKAGMYEIDGVKGHLTIRAMNMKIPGLNVAKPHGQQGYFDRKGKLIQDRSKEKRNFINKPGFLHFTHLPRASKKEVDAQVPKRTMKLKYEVGKSFPSDFFYPEVFFLSRPAVVKSPWEKMDMKFWMKSLALTIPRKIKRRVIKSGIGY